MQQPRQTTAPRGVPTFTVHEMAGEYVYYRPNASQALARFDKERLVIAAARKVGVALGAEQMRVVFIIPTIPE